MGHKENLLAAARECLLRGGYARTSVRDLVAASGANQASINYHFGSKDELLTRAVHDLTEEWCGLLSEVLADGDGTRGETAHVARWQRIIASVRANRELWFLTFETVAHARHDEELRAVNAAAQQTARTTLAHAFGGLGPEADPADVRAVGGHYYSLLAGVALQWLTDPGAAPSAVEVVRADRPGATP